VDSVISRLKDGGIFNSVVTPDGRMSKHMMLYMFLMIPGRLECKPYRYRETVIIFTEQI
jgi:hypothetical protein